MFPHFFNEIPSVSFSLMRGENNYWYRERVKTDKENSEKENGSRKKYDFYFLPVKKRINRSSQRTKSNTFDFFFLYSICISLNVLRRQYTHYTASGLKRKLETTFLCRELTAAAALRCVMCSMVSRNPTDHNLFLVALLRKDEKREKERERKKCIRMHLSLLFSLPFPDSI